MRILYFSRDYSSHDYRFLSGLAKTGHTIGYLRLEKSAYPQEQRQLPENVSAISWRGGKDIFRWTDYMQLLNSLKDVINTFRPDVILAGPIQRTAFMVALTEFRPLVSMSWGYDLLIDAERSPIWSWITGFTLRRSAALVADCDTTSQLATRYGIDPGRIVSFPWGVDLDHFSPRQEDKLSKQNNRAPLTLLSTRSWEPVCGVDVLAEGFVKASSQIQDLRLIMLNSGSQKDLINKILAPVQNKFSTLPIDEDHPSPAVYLPGQKTYDELPNIYRQANLYIAATHSDGSSISMLEAMACGIPVLVSDIPGNQEWVEEGRNGWLFRDGDPNALADAIRIASANRAKLPEMGSYARQIAEKRANWCINFPRLMDAFEIALNLPNGAFSL